MDIRKLLPAVLLGTALVTTGHVVLAKENGGNDRGGQHESRGGDRETRDDGKADRETRDDRGARGDRGNVQHEDRGGKEDNNGGRDPDNVQHEEQGQHGGENGGPDSAMLMKR